MYQKIIALLSLSIMLIMLSKMALAASPNAAINLPPQVSGNTQPNSLFQNLVTVNFSATTMTVRSTGLPNHEYGPFPSLGNPNSARAQNLRFDIPRQPRLAGSPTDTPIGPIGIAINGVPFFNPHNAQRQNVVQGTYAEIFDGCNGHPDELGIYHYHQIPDCLVKDIPGQHSVAYGYAFDGFAIYGPQSEYGLAPTDLDECNGHRDAVRGYHYHMTRSFPYIIGCYSGIPTLPGPQGLPPAMQANVASPAYNSAFYQRPVPALPQNAAPPLTDTTRRPVVRKSPFYAYVTVSYNATQIIVESDGLPDHEHGPSNSITAQDLRFTIPRQPRLAKTTTATPLGPIGIAINGVVFFNPYNGRGQDTVTGPYAEAFDGCSGHSEPGGLYHYHQIPNCLLNDMPGRHSQLYGYAFDGFPIYGPQGVNGTAPTDLDECNGHRDNIRGYHYHMTQSYPYIIGCYKGTPNLE